MIVAILWAVIFTLAAAFSLYNLREAQRDAAALKRTKKNGPFSRVALGTMREEAVRFVAFSVYGVLGLVALLGIQGLQGFYTIGLLFGGVGMLFNSYQSFTTRRAVLAHGDMRESPTTQQSPSRRQSKRVVGSARGSRLGHGPERKNRNAPKRPRGNSR